MRLQSISERSIKKEKKTQTVFTVSKMKKTVYSYTNRIRSFCSEKEMPEKHHGFRAYHCTQCRR